MTQTVSNCSSVVLFFQKMLLTLVFVLVIVMVLIHYYHKSKRGVCKSGADLSGKTVLITGANGGMFNMRLIN